MKKTLFIFLSLIVFSCGKDELAFDLNASGDLSEQTIEQAKKTIYGKWDFGNSSKSSGLGKKNSQVTNSIFGKRYARNNSKSSGQGKNLSCAFDFIEFNDNTYIMAIISDDRTEYLSGDYVINENSDKKVTSVDLKLILKWRNMPSIQPFVREYREMNDVDETEYTDNITITTSANQLNDYLSNYDQLYAYEITSISASDSVKVNDEWRQGGSLGDIYYVDKVSGGTQSTPVTMSVSYKKVNYPNYRFSTTGIAPTILTEESQVDSVMDLINVVPNPYYAYSTYEGVENGGQLDSRVRLTNLPEQCVISIYSLDGSLVKKLNKDSEGSATIDWDLKNQKGIPISSGAYIINVSVPSLGKEKNLKWFGVLRPIDLDTF